MNIGVLASHGGSTLQAIIDASTQGELAAQVCLVISNNSQSGALQRARKHGISTHHVSKRTHPEAADRDQYVCGLLQKHEIDLVVLAGYMQRLGEQTLSAFNGKVLNTHPALLPKYGGAGFYGRRVHEAVIAAGDTQSGATVHWVAAEYDTGPIIEQVTVAVKPDDSAESLESRVKQAEKQLLLKVIEQLAKNHQASL